MNKISNLILVLVAALFIISCSSGGGDSTPAAPIGDITGGWSVDETSDATDCGRGVIASSYLLNVTSQTGSAISLTFNANVLNGTFAGNKVTVSGSYPQLGGTTTGNFAITVGPACNSFSGTGTWSWTDGVDSCSGTLTLTGTRNNSTGCGNATSTSDTESEQNDAPNAADTLTAGVPMTGTTTSTVPEDDDYYVFTVPVDGKYKFSINYDNANTITMVLRDVNLSVLTSNTISIESTVILSAGTTFYIQIDPYTTSGTVPYTLTVNSI